jgi:uncharacterized protein (DUF952 family)
MTTRLIYHICLAEEWNSAKLSGRYSGSSQDKMDGFIHFSSGQQVIESAEKHRFGQDNLILLEVNSQKLGINLKWELSRNSEKFPHLYGDLPVIAVIRSFDLKLNASGTHMFPKNWDLG